LQIQPWFSYSSLNICNFCLGFQELGFREPTELIKAKFELLGCDQCSIISNNFCQSLGKEIWEIFELKKVGISKRDLL
jgi:hypothetical protein